jgi:hypothetical protein
MAFEEVDSRQADADREFNHWTQQGADPDVVSTMLPALVASDDVTRESAARFLHNYGSVGHGPNNAAAAEAVDHAREFLHELMEDGGFSYDPMYDDRGRHSMTRHSEAQINEAWDEMTPNVGPYADKRNHEVIEESDVLAGLDRGETTFSEDPDTGVITAHYRH